MDESRLVAPSTCDKCRGETTVMNKLEKVKSLILKENGHNLEGKLSILEFFHLFCSNKLQYVHCK